MFNQLFNQLMQSAQGMVSSTSANLGASQQNTGLSGMLKNPAVTGALSGVGGGLLAGLLLSNKGMRKLATLGGIAALGVIATKAYRNYQANKNQSNSAQMHQDIQQLSQSRQSNQAVLDFDHAPKANQEELSRALLTSIIAAAKADGHFDDRERQIIREQTEKIDNAEMKAWVQQEIHKQLDINKVASMATSPEMASEIYLVSLLVIDEQNEREKTYLNSLAEKLGLEPQLRKEIEQQLKVS
ncbi:MAG: tellurite resistance TerB family protein [Tannerella sp.]|jgi:uncharacterized membrane protein YebE (DUF533 family)|nr:tellurite resistance TerB family protein [Tannerella sp.]